MTDAERTDGAVPEDNTVPEENSTSPQGSTGPENDSPRDDILRVEHISKNYGAVTALTDINLRLGRGEVLGLIGDNGAGKSTLLKILCGFQPPSSGQILLEGQEVRFKSVVHARSLGIDAVYQDLALIPQLTVFENMFLNREKVTWPLLNSRAMRREAQQHLAEIGVRIPNISTPVARLSGGQRQAIAVARSVFSNPKILLLDEPLAAMGVKEGSLILDLITQLKEQGNVSIIIIAHNYGQVLEVCDRVNLIQDGKITLDKRSAETSADELTEIVVAEYRKALADRRLEASGGA
jgi:ABC-type sugar transport system ATPase subunit